MPAGIPVMTMSIGVAGAKNAALSAASILALNNPSIAKSLNAFRKQQSDHVIDHPNPETK